MNLRTKKLFFTSLLIAAFVLVVPSGRILRAEDGSGLPACSDFIDNDGDGAIDNKDPDCHTDGNAQNNDSYDPSGLSEGVLTPGLPACSDFVDNDADGKIDNKDPGCHTDGNADNNDSYDPSIMSEVDPAANIPPTASSPDLSITLPTTSATLVATAADSDGTIASYFWKEVVAGNPSVSTVVSPNSATTDVTGLTQVGTYAYKLVVTDDKGAIAVVHVKVTVNPEPVRRGGGGGGGGSYVPPTIIPTPAPTSAAPAVAAPVPTVLGAETSCGLYLDSFIRVGYKKNDPEEVKKLQTFLNDYQHANLPVTGVYGPMTLAAVKTFQANHADKILTPWGVTAPTGIVYLTTKQEINNVMCPSLNLPVPTNLVPFSKNTDIIV